MLAYAIDTPSPATVVVITGDRDFAYALSILKLRGYQIVLVTLPNAHVSLTAQSSIRYDWQNDVLNPSVAPNRDPVPSSHVRRKSAVDDRNPQTPPQLWRNLPSGTSAQEGTSLSTYRYVQKTPARLVDPPSDAQFGQRGGSNNTLDVDLALKHATSPSKRKIYTIQDAKTTPSLNDFASYRPDSLESGFNKLEGPFQEDDMPSDMEFSPDSSPKMGPNESVILEGERLSHLTIGAGSKSPASSMQEAASPTLSQGTLVSTSSLRDRETDVFESCSSSPIPPTLLSRLSEAPISEAKSIWSPATTPQTKEPIQPLIVPSGFEILVRVLQEHRKKGYYISYCTVIAGRISKGGTTYRAAGTNNFRQYLSLAKDKGIIELGGEGQAAWIRLTPNWYDAVVTT